MMVSHRLHRLRIHLFRLVLDHILKYLDEKHKLGRRYQRRSQVDT